jgi:jumonji domain-containing protein 2
LDKLNITIANPISQVVCKSKGNEPGYYQQLNITKKSMPVKAFSELANTPRYMTPSHNNFEELEKIYWETVNGTHPPIYGADVCGSITDDDCNVSRPLLVFSIVSLHLLLTRYRFGT